jgi:hypothetical protein
VLARRADADGFLERGVISAQLNMYSGYTLPWKKVLALRTVMVLKNVGSLGGLLCSPSFVSRAALWLHSLRDVGVGGETKAECG